MKRFYIGTMCLILVTAVSVAKAKSSPLSIRDKRAACSVVFYHILYGTPFSRYKFGEVPKEGKHQKRLFLNALDESGREVTPAALITALRREGLNVYPAWTENKWRSSSDPKRLIGIDCIRLTQFKYIGDNHIKWRVQEWGIVPKDSDHDNSLTQSTIETKKKNGHWKVVGLHIDFAAN